MTMMMLAHSDQGLPDSRIATKPYVLPQVTGHRTDPDLNSGQTICFGPFRLLRTQRLLLEDNQPLRIGSRALDILLALLERPGELITKEELSARAWPDTFVEQANLAVHISVLRRVLGDGREGRRFLINIPGRGYRFVAPVKVSEEEDFGQSENVVEHRHNLPARMVRLIGREAELTEVAGLLSGDRLVTIIGTGGIGKTSVAVAVAEKLIANYRDGAWLVDLGAISDPLLVPSTVVSVVGSEICPEDTKRSLISILRNREMLLILDNCEHVVAAAADLIAALLRAAPGLRVLTTSREPLRTEGERIYRLAPLQSAPPDTVKSSEQALRFPAIKLFVERAEAVAGEFVLGDAEAPTLAQLCQKLDGIPLAIEFAAARVNGFGINGLADRLGDTLSFLTTGNRTAVPRHQTMRASLDWSYQLLTESQKVVLRRLSVFSGEFTLRAAGAIISDQQLSTDEAIEQVANLVAKSLVIMKAGGAEPRLRFMETTRAYALAKLAESGELDAITSRHAQLVEDSDGHSLDHGTHQHSSHHGRRRQRER